MVVLDEPALTAAWDEVTDGWPLLPAAGALLLFDGDVSAAPGEEVPAGA